MFTPNIHLPFGPLQNGLMNSLITTQLGRVELNGDLILAFSAGPDTGPVGDGFASDLPLERLLHGMSAFLGVPDAVPFVGDAPASLGVQVGFCADARRDITRHSHFVVLLLSSPFGVDDDVSRSMMVKRVMDLVGVGSGDGSGMQLGRMDALSSMLGMVFEIITNPQELIIPIMLRVLVTAGRTMTSMTSMSENQFPASIDATPDDTRSRWLAISIMVDPIHPDDAGISSIREELDIIRVHVGMDTARE